MLDLEAVAQQRVRQRHEAIEMMCEAMLTHDLGGVLVIERGIDWTVQLSFDVPWGEIHYRMETA